MLAALRRTGGPAGGVTAHVRQPAVEARCAAWPEGIHPLVRRALARRGIERPWTHQARCLELALRGRDAVVVTPTASGKSLCFAAPVLSSCLRDPDARALLIFPTKALALDQSLSLSELLAEVRELARDEGSDVPDLSAATFDGDTPVSARRAVRERARIVVTNPDMLHAGILPHHPRWAALFQGLRHVVLDELHSYRGVFGSHVANVLRRLRRTCAFHGSSPVFTCCSATIANPKEHAEALLERPVELVADSGAPRGERHLVFYNPPVVDEQLGIRSGALGSTRRIATRCLEAGLQTIVFATSRLSVEILARYLKEAMARRRRSPRLVEPYRGGHLPRVRRDVQERLRSGALRGVVSTNALELGLDVGSLDVAVLCGHPGSIASCWQQAGRAGRRGSASACILVARSTPLDQHVIQHPEYFLESPPEHARIDPDNLLIVAEHVKCAAFELPIRRGETHGGLDAEELAELLGVFEEEGLVHREDETWHWTQETHPAAAISLRCVSSDNFVVVDVSEPSHRVIAEVDFASAPTTIHEKAIYMCGAEQYQVEHLDHDNRRAHVRRVDCDYFTDAMTSRRVSVLEIFRTETEAGEAPEAPAGRVFSHGEVRVSRRVVGFKKLRFYTMENVGYGDVVLPEHEMHAPATWCTLTPAGLGLLARGGMSRRAIVEGLVAATRALHGVAAVLAACDPRDIGWAIGDARGAGGRSGAAWSARPAGGGLVLDGAPESAPQGSSRHEAPDLDALETFEPTAFLHDGVPGGIGLSVLLYERRAELVDAALELVERCRCSQGCPACVGAPFEVGARAKEDGRAVLRVLAGPGATAGAGASPDGFEGPTARSATPAGMPPS